MSSGHSTATDRIEGTPTATPLFADPETALHEMPSTFSCSSLNPLGPLRSSRWTMTECHFLAISDAVVVTEHHSSPACQTSSPSR